MGQTADGPCRPFVAEWIGSLPYRGGTMYPGTQPGTLPQAQGTPVSGVGWVVSVTRLGRLFRPFLWMALAIGLLPTQVAYPQFGSSSAALEWRNLLNQGKALSRQGRYFEAEQALIGALREAEGLGSNDPRIGVCLNSLAIFYQRLGNHGAAEPMFRRAVSVLEAGLGPDHPDLGKAYLNLGQSYRSQSRFEEADQAFGRWLKITETAHGSDSADLASDLRNLALMHYMDRRFYHAERLLARSLAILERRSDQRKTQAACLSDLGVVYLASGKVPNAANALLRSLVLAEELLGADHIQVARTLGHLSKAYRHRLHYAEAERVLNRSLAIREKSQPANQSELATGLNELGTLYRIQGLFTRAEGLFERSSRIWKEVAGQDHPETGISIYNMALLYRDAGRVDEAAPLFERSLGILARTLGPDHPQHRTAKLAYEQFQSSRATP